MRSRLFLFLAVALPLMLLLQACPHGLSHPLAEQGEAIEEAGLIGTWRVADNKAMHEMDRVRVEKGAGKTLLIRVLERTSDYMLTDTVFPAWPVVLNDRHVLVAFGAADSVFFHYGYDLKKGQLTLYDLALAKEMVDPSISAAAIRKGFADCLGRPDCYENAMVYMRE